MLMCAHNVKNKILRSGVVFFGGMLILAVWPGLLYGQAVTINDFKGMTVKESQGENEGLLFWLAYEDTAKNRRYYQSLSPADKARLKKKAKAWQSLSPEEKSALRGKMQRLNNMPAAERKKYRQRHEQWQTLSPRERQNILKSVENWEQLNPQEKQTILRRFKKY